MKNLSPEFISAFALEISRLSKAIRAVQKLDSSLPKNFPPPSSIRSSRKPFDLVLTWEPSSRAEVTRLQERLCAAYGVLYHSWRPAPAGLQYNGRIKLRGKDSLNLSLVIKIPVQGP